MGMFDYVRCNYRLPGDPSPTVQNAEFQTKDFECELRQYVIDEEGRINIAGNFTGTLNIYCSNVVGSGPGVYTANGEDEEWGDYDITFVDGKVAQAVCNDSGRRPALKMGDHVHLKTEEEIKEEHEIQERAEAAIQSGASKLCLWWGGRDEGVMVDVVFRHKTKLAIINDDELEVIDIFGAGRTLFASLEDGRRWKEIKDTSWNRGRDDYEAHVKKGS